MNSKCWTLVAAAAAVLVTLAPTRAQACGGTFCDIGQGPTIMPVDQTGETLVFWIDESGTEPFTEAHIQIQYEGDPEEFAWIIPVTAVPEVLVGSQALFDNMLQATVPIFVQQTTSVGDCNSFGGFGCMNADAASADGGFENFGETGAAEGGGGPDILDRGFAGAFEYVTLTGDSVDEIITWLDMAGYAQDEDAPPILEEYLQEDFVFVAVKLRSGTDVEEIHPLAIRYPGVEPCIPIRLTRIAAVDDMAIRAMFLGDARVAPTNWPHVVLNHSRLDYAFGAATSYPQIVSLAIDEAGGRAFVTEYAGTDAVVSTTAIHDPLWNSAAFTEVEVYDVIYELAAQNLIACLNGCRFEHPLLESLLLTYLPPPDGVDAHDYWECMDCYAAMIDLDTWDAVAFAAAFEERIVQPGQHALDMLADADYLTRLYTVISPHEMIEDPLFHENGELDNVGSGVSSNRVVDCEGGPTYIEMPDGRDIALANNGGMPGLDLPAAERIEQIPLMGPPQIEVDNGPDITAAIDAWNDSQLVGPEPNCSVRRAPVEGMFGMLALFGIAWLHRGRRGRA
jgi:hypothetical protein